MLYFDAERPEIARAARWYLEPVDATFRPDPARQQVYGRLYAEFPELYRAQKGMFRRLNPPAAERNTA